MYVADRTLVRRDYVQELRQLYGVRFDELAPLLKDVLGLVFRFDRYSTVGAVSAKEASFELWASRGGAQDIQAFDAFYRKVRRAFNQLQAAGFVEKKAEARGYSLAPSAPAGVETS